MVGRDTSDWTTPAAIATDCCNAMAKFADMASCCDTPVITVVAETVIMLAIEGEAVGVPAMIGAGVGPAVGGRITVVAPDTQR